MFMLSSNIINTISNEKLFEDNIKVSAFIAADMIEIDLGKVNVANATRTIAACDRRPMKGKYVVDWGPTVYYWSTPDILCDEDMREIWLSEYHWRTPLIRDIYYYNLPEPPVSLKIRTGKWHISFRQNSFMYASEDEAYINIIRGLSQHPELWLF